MNVVHPVSKSPVVGISWFPRVSFSGSPLFANSFHEFCEGHSAFRVQPYHLHLDEVTQNKLYVRIHGDESDR